MKLWSNSWTNGDRIPERHAAGRPDGAGGATFSDNLNPYLAWSDLPAGTQSLVLGTDGLGAFDIVTPP